MGNEGGRARLRLRRPGWTHATATEPRVLLALLAVMGAQVLLGLDAPAWMPLSALVLPLLAAGYLLARRLFRVVAGAAAVATVLTVAVLGFRDARPGAVALIAVCGVIGDRLALARERTGVRGLRGGAMLADLRDRLLAQGAVPPLPAGWSCDVVVRSAEASSLFSGDFVVAAVERCRSLEMALVDVSGKGLDAGTRALLLSGAFGGLLGSLPPEQFLGAANRYLVRQDWDEGFATAVHVCVDLDSGDYLLSSAGHPPAAHFDAGSGRWQLVEASGTVLGFLDEPATVQHRGRMRPGDALLLYTDGLVETPGQDLAVGIDRLLGEADRLVTRGFDDAATWLVERASPSKDDDRGVVVLHRSR